MGSKISTHGAGPGAGVSDDEAMISILPDHLLQHILSFIPAQDAVRTGVLSRRWQHVWVEAPTFAFSDDTQSTAGFADSLEKVLARSRSHHVDVLKISIRHPLHMARANVWLQQAVERVHGSTSISFVFPPNDCSSALSAGNRIVLDLPCGGRTTALSLDVSTDGIGTLRVPPASAAVSSSLTELSLKSLRLDGSRFSDFVSSSCPHLRKLFLHTFGNMDHLRLSNDALEDLDLDFTSGSCTCRGLRQLQVSSRNLRRLRIHDIFSPEVRFNEVHDGSKVASFRTPRLEHLFWTCSAFMHPSRVEFADSLATVRRLDLALMTHAWVDDTYLFHNKLAVWLLRHCTGVRCLKLALWDFARDIVRVLDEASLAQYEDLMVSIPQLSSVSDLTVMTMLDHHAYGASIASLLSRCNYVERLTIIVRDKRLEDKYACVDAAMCWCKCPANWREQKLRLDFLWHVDFRGFKGSTGWMADLSRLLRSPQTNGASEDPTTPLLVYR